MSERLTFLFNRFLSRTLTEAERIELMGLGLERKYQEQLQLLIAEAGEKLIDEHEMDEEKATSIFQFIIEGREEAKVINFKNKFNWKKLVVAATVLFAMITAGYFLLNKNKDVTKEQIVKVPDDIIAPSTNRAMITLADGSSVYLDSAANGELIQQGNIKLIKLANGQIAYQTASGEVIKELKYNTINNPRGSKVIDMTLVDGSRVWLNAGSSVTFPVAFIGNERKVSVTGEAYFEIAPDKAKPFIVSKGTTSITVLGTHFNINAYEDEKNIAVTLLEGSVRVSADAGSLTIKPDQQVLIQSTGAIALNKNVNVEQVMAWKNGVFDFSKSDIGTIMRQIARWYDVEVEYEGAIPGGTYTGDVNRNTNVSNVLKILKLSGVNYRIEGKKIIVLK